MEKFAPYAIIAGIAFGGVWGIYLFIRFLLQAPQGVIPVLTEVISKPYHFALKRISRSQYFEKYVNPPVHYKEAGEPYLGDTLRKGRTHSKLAENAAIAGAVISTGSSNLDKLADEYALNNRLDPDMLAEIRSLRESSEASPSIQELPSVNRNVSNDASREPEQVNSSADYYAQDNNQPNFPASFGID